MKKSSVLGLFEEKGRTFHEPAMAQGEGDMLVSQLHPNLASVNHFHS